MQKKIKNGFFILFFLICITGNSEQVDASGWIEFPSKENISLMKTFTITFNQEINFNEIDGIVIVHKNHFIPVDIELTENKVLVTPVHPFLEDETYELRIFIGEKRYKMAFHTVEPQKDADTNATLSYKGKVDVISKFAESETIENINHYILNMGEGHPIDIYVTDDYISKFGEGFAYDEVDEMLKEISLKKEMTPYTLRDATLKMFFYTNESGTPLPKDRQAVAGSWSSNAGYGVPTELIMNGSTMPYDFRGTLFHELWHYADFQSYVNRNDATYRNYWGNNYRFWLLEGGAEYSANFFYKRPENTYNRLSDDIILGREEIIEEAKRQKGYKQNLLYEVELNSFDDIYKASDNNYGITLSLFWYLAETYGYSTIYDYVKHVGEAFSPHHEITLSDKEDTAKKFFGKTEEQIITEWLLYFNTFDGELEPYRELTTATANYIFFEDDPMLTDFMIKDLQERKAEGLTFIVNVKEWIEEKNHQQSHTFREHMTYDFKLIAEGYPEVSLKPTGGFLTGAKYANGEWIHAWKFNISTSELSKLVNGVPYTIVPLNNDEKYKWVFPEDLKFIYE